MASILDFDDDVDPTPSPETPPNPTQQAAPTSTPPRPRATLDFESTPPPATARASALDFGREGLEAEPSKFKNFGRNFLRRLIFEGGPTVAEGMNRLGEWLDPMGPSRRALSTLAQKGGLTDIDIEAERVKASQAELEEFTGAFREKGREIFPSDPALRGDFVSETLPTAAADFMTVLGVAAVTGPLGGAMAGASMAGEMSYEEAKAMGADDKTASLAFLGNAALGATEVITPLSVAGKIAPRMNKLLPPGAVSKATGMVNKLNTKIAAHLPKTAEALKRPSWQNVVLTAAKGGSVETVQEMIQETGSNAIAQQLYDENRELFENIGQAGGAGGTIGVLYSAIAAATGQAKLARRLRMEEQFRAAAKDVAGLEVDDSQVEDTSMRLKRETGQLKDDLKNRAKRKRLNVRISQQLERIASLQQLAEESPKDNKGFLAQIDEAQEKIKELQTKADELTVSEGLTPDKTVPTVVARVLGRIDGDGETGRTNAVKALEAVEVVAPGDVKLTKLARLARLRAMPVTQLEALGNALGLDVENVEGLEAGRDTADPKSVGVQKLANNIQERAEQVQRRLNEERITGPEAIAAVQQVSKRAEIDGKLEQKLAPAIAELASLTGSDLTGLPLGDLITAAVETRAMSPEQLTKDYSKSELESVAAMLGIEARGSQEATAVLVSHRAPQVVRALVSSGVDIVDLAKTLGPGGPVVADFLKPGSPAADKASIAAKNKTVTNITATRMTDSEVDSRIGRLGRQAKAWLSSWVDRNPASRIRSAFRTGARYLVPGALTGPVFGQTKAGSDAKAQVDALLNSAVGEAMTKAIEDANLPPSSQHTIYRALVGEIDPTGKLPDEVVRTILAVRSRMDQMSEAIFNELELAVDNIDDRDIKLQILGRMQAIAANIGTYTTRFYAADFDAGYRRRMESTDPEMKAKRDAAIDEVQEQLTKFGELDGLNADDARQRAADLLDAISAQHGTTAFIDGLDAKVGGPVGTQRLKKREGIGPAVRDFLGEVKEPFLAIQKTLSDQTLLLSELRLMRDLSEFVGSNGETFASDLPSTAGGFTVPLPNAYNYGAMAGKYVSYELAKTFEDISQDSRRMQAGFWDKAMAGNNKFVQGFKLAKTVYNPGTHGRNVLGNITSFAEWANISAVNPANFKYYRQAARALGQFHGLTSDVLSPEVKEMVESGVLPAQFFKDPRMRDLYNEFARSVEKGNDIVNGLRDTGKKFGDDAVRMYLMEDQVFRVAAYMKARETGVGAALDPRGKREVDAKTAAQWVNKFFPDYDNNPLIIQKLSNTGFIQPFISFFVATPRAAVNAITHNPVKFAQTTAMHLAAVASMPGLHAILAPENKDEERKAEQWKKDSVTLRKLLPSYAKQSAVFEQDGRVVTWNLQTTFPMADYLHIAQSTGEVDDFAAGWELTKKVLFGSPLIGGLVKFAGGNITDEAYNARIGVRTPLTSSRPAPKESPLMEERMAILATHIVESYMPSFVGGDLTQAVQGFRGETDVYGRGKDPALELLGFVGASLNEPSWDVQHYFQTWDNVNMLQERTNHARRLNDVDSGASADEFADEITRLQAARDRYATERTELNEALDVAKRIGGTMTLPGRKRASQISAHTRWWKDSAKQLAIMKARERRERGR
jgi:hypothetical protein